MTSALDIYPNDLCAGVGIIEKSINGSFFLTYSYPSFPKETTAVILSRASVTEPIISRYDKYYLYHVPGTPSNNSVLSKTKAFIIVIQSKAFLPEAFLTLANIFVDIYKNTGSTVHIETTWLTAYSFNKVPKILTNYTLPLSTPTKASLTNSETVWDMNSFDPQKVYKPSQAKNVLASIGVESILIWTALILNKRIAVYGNELSKVIRTVRILPLLMIHRYPSVAQQIGLTLSSLQSSSSAPKTPSSTPNNLSNIMFPFITLSDYTFTRGAVSIETGQPTENNITNNLDSSLTSSPLSVYHRQCIEEGTTLQIMDLQKNNTFIAGFVDPLILSKGNELWDICVDLVNHTVIVAENSKTELTLGSVHREVAKALVETLENPSATDITPIQAIYNKTIALIERLLTWFPQGIPSNADTNTVIQFQAVMKQQNIPATVERFLWGMTTCEPLLQAKN